MATSIQAANPIAIPKSVTMFVAQDVITGEPIPWRSGTLQSLIQRSYKDQYVFGAARGIGGEGTGDWPGAKRWQADASTAQSHTHTTRFTSQPLGAGANIIDHGINEPSMFTFTGILADYGKLDTSTLLAIQQAFAEDTAIGKLTQSISNLLTLSPRVSRALRLYDELTALQRRKTLLSVITSTTAYERAVIESIELPRGAGDGNALQVRVSMREIQFASSVIVRDVPEIDIQQIGGGASDDRGLQNLQPVTRTETNFLEDLTFTAG